jgi:hypothetical protein
VSGGDSKDGSESSEDVVGAMIRALYADLLGGAKAAAPPPGGFDMGKGGGEGMQKGQQQQAPGSGATDAVGAVSIIGECGCECGLSIERVTAQKVICTLR